MHLIIKPTASTGKPAPLGPLPGNISGHLHICPACKACYTDREFNPLTIVHQERRRAPLPRQAVRSRASIHCMAEIKENVIKTSEEAPDPVEGLFRFLSNVEIPDDETLIKKANELSAELEKMNAEDEKKIE